MRLFPAEHFGRHEFTCRCGCGSDTVDAELLAVLEQLRDDVGQPVVVVSGYRCHAHNTKVGGAPNSYHLAGKAADIEVVTLTPPEVYNLLDRRYPHTFGIGLYRGWVHIDVRSKKSRW